MQADPTCNDKLYIIWYKRASHKLKQKLPTGYDKHFKVSVRETAQQNENQHTHAELLWAFLSYHALIIGFRSFHKKFRFTSTTETCTCIFNHSKAFWVSLTQKDLISFGDWVNPL